MYFNISAKPNMSHRLTYKYVTENFLPFTTHSDEVDGTIFTLFQNGYVAYKCTDGPKSHTTVFHLCELCLCYEFADCNKSINIWKEFAQENAYMILKMYAEMRLADNNLKKTPSKGLESIDDYDGIPVPDDFTTEIHAAFDDRERYATLHEALGTLTEKQKTAVRLRYFEELKQEEIARIMGISRSSVRDLIDGAEKKIKKFFRNHHQN